MKELFLILYLIFSVTNLFTGKWKRCSPSILECYYKLEDQFLYDSNFAFYMDGGDIFFYQKNTEKAFQKINLNFHVAAFIGIEIFDQKQDDVFCRNILVLAKDRCLYSVKLEVEMQNGKPGRYWVTVEKVE